MLCALPEHFAVRNFSGTQQIGLLPCVDTKTHGTNRAHNKGSFCCVPHKSHHTAKKKSMFDVCLTLDSHQNVDPEMLVVWPPARAVCQHTSTQQMTHVLLCA